MQDDEEPDAVAVYPADDDDFDAKEAAPTKVMRCQRLLAALVAIPNASGTSDYQLVTAEIPSAPFVVERTTAENLAAAFEQRSPVRHWPLTDFVFKTRLCVSDRLAAQILADRIVTERRPAWDHLYFPCEVHMSTKAMAKSLLLLDDAVSGVIRTVLTLRSGGWMRMFRKCLSWVVSSSLEILNGASPPEDKFYRRLCTSMFLGRRRRRQRTLLLTELTCT